MKTKASSEMLIRRRVAVCGGAIELLSDERIAIIHEETGHHGIKQMLHFSRKLSPAVTKKDVRRVVKVCQVFQSIDPAPVKLARGKSMLMTSGTYLEWT